MTAARSTTSSRESRGSGSGDRAPAPPTTLPHNVEAETAVLAHCLLDNQVFHLISASLTPPDFHAPLHGAIYTAIASLIADDRRADVVTLSPKLREMNIGEASAYDYVATLPDSAPTDVTITAAYVEEILRYSSQRSMLEAAAELTKLATSRDARVHDIASSVTAKLEASINRIKPKRITQRSVGEFAQIALDNAMDPNKKRGIKTQIDAFDKRTGGLFPGDFSILGGRPSSGKTVLATQIALNLAKQNRGVLYLSLEMDGEAMAQRTLSSESFTDHYGIHYTKFRSDELDERDFRLLQEAQQRIATIPLQIETHTSLTLQQVVARCRQLKADWEAIGQSLDVLIVDYLTLLKFSDRWKGQRVYEVAELSTGMKDLARTLDMHVMAVHQLSRQLENRDDKRPMMSDLRESGQLEQDADLIMMCYREAYYLERALKKGDLEAEEMLRKVKHKMELNIVKQRMGAVGSIELYCSVACNVIRNLGAY